MGKPPFPHACLFTWGGTFRHDLEIHRVSPAQARCSCMLHFRNRCRRGSALVRFPLKQASLSSKQPLPCAPPHSTSTPNLLLCNLNDERGR